VRCRRDFSLRSKWRHAQQKRSRETETAKPVLFPPLPQQQRAVIPTEGRNLFIRHYVVEISPFGRNDGMHSKKVGNRNGEAVSVPPYSPTTTQLSFRPKGGICLSATMLSSRFLPSVEMTACTTKRSGGNRNGFAVSVSPYSPNYNLSFRPKGGIFIIAILCRPCGTWRHLLLRYRKLKHTVNKVSSLRDL
jgi:hypothetical protein